MVLITTRNKDPRVWGPRVNMRELTPLDDATAAKVLTDLAPAILDPTAQQARELGHRLGGLPLALHLVGTCLASPFARWRSFADYSRALDSSALPLALSDLDDRDAQARATIQRTWDLSVEALAADGLPQTRFILFLLSCYAPVAPIPTTFLDPELLTEVLELGQSAESPDELASIDAARQLRDGLYGLATTGLIDIADAANYAATSAVMLHPIITDVNRSRLLTTARSNLSTICEAAVKLLQNATHKLDYRYPADWPTWYILVPHLSAMLGWLGQQLTTDVLIRLLTITGPATDAMVMSGRLAAAEKLAHASLAAATRLGTEHPAALIARRSLTAVVAERGNSRQAEQLYLQLLSDQQRVLGGDHLETLKSRHDLAWVIAQQGRYEDAEQLYYQLLDDEHRVLGDDHPETLRSRYRLAWVIADQGRAGEAEELNRQVLAVQRRVLGEDHPDTLATLGNLARVLADQGQYPEAEQMWQRLLTERRRILGDDHPDTLHAWGNLVLVILQQGRFSEAERLSRQLIDEKCRALGEDHPATLTARHNLAGAITGQGRYLEAEQQYRQLLIDEQHLLGDSHPDTLRTRNNLASALAGQGKHQEAEQQYRQLLVDAQNVLGDSHPETLAMRHNLAKALVGQRRYQEAEQLYRQLLADEQHALGPNHPETLSTGDDVARLITLKRQPRLELS
jgi:tetratricopeptide (TPR) repeat protein